MRVGLVVDDMGGELARRGLEAAQSGLSEYNTDFVIFSKNAPMCAFPKSLVPRFSLSESWSYSGLLVTTSLESLEIVSAFPRLGGIVHYVWEPDWNEAEFKKVKALISNIPVVVRSSSHEKIIVSSYGVQPVGTTYFPDFKYFYEVFNGDTV